MSDATVDPWAVLRQRTWTCASCGQAHQGIFDLGAVAPARWQGASTPLPNSAIHDSTHCLTEDFCVIDGEHYFIRCLLKLPLAGAADGECFAFGVWSSLAEKSFRTYVATLDEGQQGKLGPWFGYFSNRLAGYPDTLSLKCRVHPRDGRERPWIEIDPSSGHPLVTESRQGITCERLLEIYAADGHVPASDA